VTTETGDDPVVEIKGTIDELRVLLGNIDDSSVVVEKQTEVVMEKPKKKRRKLSDWQRYIKNRSNHIKFKSGKRKGQLDLAKMSKAFKRGRKK
jgi:hypothetical protein